MTKIELASWLDDLSYLPEYRRSLGFRQIMRRPVDRIREDIADKMMTREQRQASYRRYWNNRGVAY